MDMDRILAQIKAQDVLPLSSWHPELSGDIDIKIDINAQWFHEGTAFTRMELVRLFSKILRVEDGEYFLVTPVEKWRIQVEDVPFMVVSAEKIIADDSNTSEPVWVMTLNTDEQFILDDDHMLTMKSLDSEQLIPYVHVRDGLVAKLSRSVYYSLVEAAQIKTKKDEQIMFIRSSGVDIELGKIA